jgi:hypothetical protein
MELSLLATPHLARAVPLLAEARINQPCMLEDLTAKTAFPPCLSGFQVRFQGGITMDRTQQPQQQQQGPTTRPDRPRVCRDCQGSHLGPWTTHACPARKQGATAPQPSTTSRKN